VLKKKILGTRKSITSTCFETNYVNHASKSISLMEVNFHKPLIVDIKVIHKLNSIDIQKIHLTSSTIIRVADNT
jgi:hypothetical protein